MLSWQKSDSSSGNPFASINDDVQANRSRVAQFAIYRAARHLSAGNQDEAIREFKNALAFDAQNTTAHTYLGMIYQSRGKMAEAIKEFTEVVQILRNRCCRQENGCIR